MIVGNLAFFAFAGALSGKEGGTHTPGVFL